MIKKLLKLRRKFIYAFFIASIFYIYAQFNIPKDQTLSVSSNDEVVRKFIHKRSHNNTVILVCLNFGYAKLFANFMQSLARISEELPQMVVIFAEEQEAYDYLLEFYPENLIPILPEGREVVVSNLSKLTGSGPQSYNSDGFKNLVSRRPERIETVIQYNVTVLYCDSDMVFLRNPFEVLDSHPKEDVLVISDQSSDNYYAGSGTVNLSSIYMKGGYCSCFVHIKPNKRSLDFIAGWKRRLIKPGLDQKFMNWAIADGYYHKKLYVDMLPPTLFPNGKFYFRTDYFLNYSTVNPYIVHANFILTTEHKIKYLKNYGLWFVHN